VQCEEDEVVAVERAGAYLQIGEVAERTGVTQRTLRFYEEKGLLNPPSRMEGGFRLYSEEDVERVEKIKQLQKLLGFSLAEIKEMVEADEVKSQIRAGYRPDADIPERRERLERALAVTERQYALIRQKLDQLRAMADEYEQKLVRYRNRMAQLEAEERDFSTATG
jgi:DNA-binding transcriptional MerR regulator